MKVTIVGGAGVVGASSAFRLAQDGQVSEIVLMDVARNVAEAHALDIEQAVVHRSGTRVRAGDIEDTQDSDVIVMTAGVPHRFSAASRSEFLRENTPLVMELVEALVAGSSNAVWIMATIPVDCLVYLAHHRYSISRQKVIGLNRNDTCRFRWALAKTLAVPSTAIEAYVVGEHGESQVPVFSQVQVEGQKMMLKPEQIEAVQAELSGFFTHWMRLKPGRTAGWTSAESIGDIVAGMMGDDGRIISCSTPLDGEYGFCEVSLGVPVKLDRKGVRDIVELPLNTEEKRALAASAAIVQDQIREAQTLLGDS